MSAPAWPKLADLSQGPLTCRCGAELVQVSVQFVPENNCFKADCPACGEFLKHLPASAFTLAENRIPGAWVVTGRTVNGPQEDQILAECASESQAFKSLASLRQAGFVHAKISKVGG